MDLRRISDTFSVSPQIDPGDVPGIKAAGFRAIMCNRPDGEEAGQCDHALIEAAAKDAGLAFYNVPITSNGISSEDMDDFNAALAEMPAPVLAYCRSGTRCTMLWSMSQVGHLPAEEIVSAAASAGYDMRGVVGQMSDQASR
ncbi:TIGR01244 family sulfur transferase [Roseovarius dicentrarchi]|uniref:TIGR01244 family sulfur transferase n=1 Tax=Roseovarius dicentrarchi TaxID=2250573 RepID=UPI000DE8C0E6|nr:TIGR01244 family sulfur transferase [Roseovarius dicentrarchi]